LGAAIVTVQQSVEIWILAHNYSVRDKLASPMDNEIPHWLSDSFVVRWDEEGLWHYLA